MNVIFVSERINCVIARISINCVVITCRNDIVVARFGCNVVITCLLYTSDAADE